MTPEMDDDALALGSACADALFEAAENGRRETVRMLLGVPGSTPCDSALMQAAARGHEAIVRMMIGVNAHRLTAKSAIIFAAAHGHESIVCLLLGLQKKKDQSRELFKSSALGIAREKGHSSVVHLLQLTDEQFEVHYAQTELDYLARHIAANRIARAYKRRLASRKTRMLVRVCGWGSWVGRTFGQPGGRPIPR